MSLSIEETRVFDAMEKRLLDLEVHLGLREPPSEPSEPPPPPKSPEERIAELEAKLNALVAPASSNQE